MPRSELFPSIEPFETGYLPVDDLHTLYWEQCGSPRGVPVLFLHGGPGAGASPTHRRFFDPSHYRIVIVDQRGAGRSMPLGSVDRNTTDLLVGDLETLRRLLGIERWFLFGGSWGSTLALAYAQAHPDRCAGLILRGIFLMRAAEIEWFLYGMRRIFPEAWTAFAGHVPPDERGDLLEAYWRRLDSADRAVRVAAARAWSRYEGACSSLLPSPEPAAATGTAAVVAAAMTAEDGSALGLARIEAHYFRANRLDPEDRLLRDIDRIRHLPAIIVQGRYDIVCPIATADDLRRAWPEAEYQIVPNAGHSAMEPGIRAALVQASERFKRLR